MYTVSDKKLALCFFGNNFAKCQLIFEILSLLERGRNLKQNMWKHFRRTFIVLLHYLVKCKRSKMTQIVHKLQQSRIMLKFHTSLISYFNLHNDLTDVCATCQLPGKFFFFQPRALSHRELVTLEQVTSQFISPDETTPTLTQ